MAIDEELRSTPELDNDVVFDLPAVQVCVRLRPLLNWEKAENLESTTLQLQAGHRGVVTLLPREGQEAQRDWEQGSAASNSRAPAARSFRFNSVLGPQSTQADLWEQSHLDALVGKVIDGFHSTVFAYGMTGSGKTHTMEGTSRLLHRGNGPPTREFLESSVAACLRATPEAQGLVPRIVVEIFQRLQRLQASSERDTFTVKVSYLQVYKEKIYDLLNPRADSSWLDDGAGLRIRWDACRNRFYVQNLFEYDCSSAQEVLQFYLAGCQNRHVATTALNAASSRSHAIFLLTLTRVSQLEANCESDPSSLREVVSTFSLVDLAGSERAAASEQAARFKEAVNINQSLFVLRRVITALSKCDRGSDAVKHIPYRESKLTSLLQHSLGGNSFMLMLACLSPADRHWEENLSTLQYATQAASIRNEPTLNLDPKDRIIQQLREELEAAHAFILRSLGLDELPAELRKVACGGPSMARMGFAPRHRESKDRPRQQRTLDIGQECLTSVGSEDIVSNSSSRLRPSGRDATSSGSSQRLSSLLLPSRERSPHPPSVPGPWAASASACRLAIAASQKTEEDSKLLQRKPSLPPQPKRSSSESSLSVSRRVLPPIRPQQTSSTPALAVYLDQQVSAYNKACSKAHVQRSSSPAINHAGRKQAASQQDRPRSESFSLQAEEEDHLSLSAARRDMEAMLSAAAGHIREAELRLEAAREATEEDAEFHSSSFSMTTAP